MLFDLKLKPFTFFFIVLLIIPLIKAEIFIKNETTFKPSESEILYYLNESDLYGITLVEVNQTCVTINTSIFCEEDTGVSWLKGVNITSLIPLDVECEWNNISFTWAEINCKSTQSDVTYTFKIKDILANATLQLYDTRTGGIRLFSGLGEDRKYNITVNVTKGGKQKIKYYELRSGDKMFENFFALAVFVVFFSIAVIFMVLMHKYAREIPGASAVFSIFATVFLVFLGAMVLGGFKVIVTDITLFFNINYYIPILCFAMAIYSIVFLVQLTNLRKYNY